ncbi:hypothetical protein [Edwardsiella tarda]|uniref:hypothetical protein n=1 Tax=Edwardsiella tarda TaxID=636 RepID=UPI000990097B|nr:hypothetical protein [Edwardsiella tarda]
MKKSKEIIKLRCVFCHSIEFAIPYADYAPHSGSFVVCAQCGRENDVTSLIITVKSRGLKLAQEYAEDLVREMKNDLIKSFGKNDFIKIS